MSIVWQNVISADKLISYIDRNIDLHPSTAVASDCSYLYNESGVVLDIQCFISGDVLDISHAFAHLDKDKINLKNNINQIWDDVVWFENIYQTGEDKFVFTGSKVIFDNTGSDYLYILQKIDKKPFDDTMLWLAKLWYKIQINYKEIARRYADHRYHFVVADRDIGLYGDCAKTNFRVAFDKLGDRVMRPWDMLDINQLFSGLDWYCKWYGAEWEIGQEFMFYQWVCGVSTQVFRLGVLSPELSVYKRQNHNTRYTVYYGDKIVWDDAAIYEDIKKLEIQNNSSWDLYILTKNWDKNRYYLVLVSEDKPDYDITIEKQTLDNMSANLKRTINYSSGSVREDNWFSQYLNISNSSN